MVISPQDFLRNIAAGKSPRLLNLVDNPKTIEEYKKEPMRKPGPQRKGTLRYYMRYRGHSAESARDFLNTDYGDGFTICRQCGSAAFLHTGFPKQISIGCHHCEGAAKYPLRLNLLGRTRRMAGLGCLPGGWEYGYFFDDSLTYSAGNVEIEKYKHLVQHLFKPIVIEENWLNPTVRGLLAGLAEQWRKNDNFHPWLPVLADALEEADCRHIEMLARLRLYSVTENKWNFWPVRLLLDHLGIHHSSKRG